MPDNGVITFDQRSSAPSSPSVGKMSLYSSGSNLSVEDPSGNVSPLAKSDGWTPASETWTYYSADSPTFSFSAGADVSGIYSEGMRVKCVLSGSETYMGIITGVSGSVVTTYGGTDYALTNNTITSQSIVSPTRFPA